MRQVRGNYSSLILFNSSHYQETEERQIKKQILAHSPIPNRMSNPTNKHCKCKVLKPLLKQTTFYSLKSYKYNWNCNVNGSWSIL